MRSEGPGVIPGLLLFALILAASPARAEVGEDQRPWSFRYAECRNENMEKLVGQPIAGALETVRAMHLQRVRVLDGRTAVNYEVIPERLTLVANQGIVTKAFCR